MMDRSRPRSTRTRVVGDVIAIKQRHIEIITQMRKRMRADKRAQSCRRSIMHTFIAFNFSGFEHVAGELVGKNKTIANHRPIIFHPAVVQTPEINTHVEYIVSSMQARVSFHNDHQQTRSIRQMMLH